GGMGTDTLINISNVSVEWFNPYADTISGTDNDNVLSTGAGDDLVDGRGGDDTLTGNGGSNTLLGGAGDDLLSATGSDDYVDGGDGTDWAIFPSPGVSVDLLHGTARETSNFNAQVNTFRLFNIENVRGGGGDDTLAGDDGANV